MYSIRLKNDSGILRIEHVGGHVPEGSFQITGEDSGGVYGGGDATRIEVEQRDPLGRFVNRAEHSHSRRDIPVPYVETYHSPTLPGRSRAVSDHFPDDDLVRGYPAPRATPGGMHHSVLPAFDGRGLGDTYLASPNAEPEQREWPGEEPRRGVRMPSIEDHEEAAQTGRSPIEIMQARIGSDAVPTDMDFERANLEAAGGQPDMRDVDEGLPVPVPQVGPGLAPQQKDVREDRAEPEPPSILDAIEPIDTTPSAFSEG